VTHVGEKLALRLVGRIRRFFCPPQFLGDLFLCRDILDNQDHLPTFCGHVKDSRKNHMIVSCPVMVHDLLLKGQMHPLPGDKGLQIIG